MFRWLTGFAGKLPNINSLFVLWVCSVSVAGMFGLPLVWGIGVKET
jgi:hypothetical protein